MKKVLLLICLMSLATSAQAQFGRKALRSDNISAATKAHKAAALSDEDMKNPSLQSVQLMDSQLGAFVESVLNAKFSRNDEKKSLTASHPGAVERAKQAEERADAQDRKSKQASAR